MNCTAGDGIDEVLGGVGDDMIFGDGDTDVCLAREATTTSMAVIVSTKCRARRK